MFYMLEIHPAYLITGSIGLQVSLQLQDKVTHGFLVLESLYILCAVCITCL